MISSTEMVNPSRTKLAACTRLILLFLVPMILLTGCSPWNSKIKLSEEEILPSEWSGPATGQNLPITSSILDMIDDPALVELVHEALEHNPNLQATAHRLRASGYLLGLTRSRLMPEISGEFNRSRSNLTLDPYTGDSKTENSNRIAAAVSWELDIWGKLADNYRASSRMFNANTYEYRMIRDVLAARVIQAWIEMSTIAAVISIENDRINVLNQMEQLILASYRNGSRQYEEVSAARSRKHLALATVSSLEFDRSRVSREIEVLAGRVPGTELSSGNELPSIPVVISSIPAEVLLARPDVKAAVSRTESIFYSTRAAKKRQLPSLTLSGQIFKENALIRNIDSGEASWSLLGSLFQPLFAGGRIRSESKAAEQEGLAAIQDLRQTVLQAIKEVENALALESSLQAQQTEMEEAVSESIKSADFFENRYRSGLVDVETMLTAREQLFDARIQLKQLQSQVLINRINLAIAAGIPATEEHHLAKLKSKSK